MSSNKVWAYKQYINIYAFRTEEEILQDRQYIVGLGNIPYERRAFNDEMDSVCGARMVIVSHKMRQGWFLKNITIQLETR